MTTAWHVLLTGNFHQADGMCDGVPFGINDRGLQTSCGGLCNVARDNDEAEDDNNYDEDVDESRRQRG